MKSIPYTQLPLKTDLQEPEIYHENTKKQKHERFFLDADSADINLSQTRPPRLSEQARDGGCL
jgi:hypothetical protein